MNPQADHDAEPALVPFTGAVEASLSQLFSAPPEAIECHNFNLEDPVEALQYVAAGCGDSEPLKDLKGLPLNITHFYARPVTYLKKTTGELVNGVRCTLIDDLGRTLSTCSPSAIRTIGMLARTRPAGKVFEPPIQVEVKESKTAAGFNCLIITPVIPKPKAPKPTETKTGK